jgi:NAD(P)-dependent dehydrogenase (short-subunit alcohol dehydrogenase family)
MGGGRVNVPAAEPSHWAVILGGSSGFGLATAHKLSEQGMSIFLVHRDRRGAMARIEPEFDRIRSRGVGFVALNTDALDPASRARATGELEKALGADGRVRLLLHSIAFGNLKLLGSEAPRDRRTIPALAARLGIAEEKLASEIDALFTEGFDALGPVAAPPAYPSSSFLDEEDFARTVESMGTSMLSWTRALLDRGLFADDARVVGLTSEGNTVAWKGYAAVAAAKVVLESLARSMALEFAPAGLRTNIVQAGVTDTPAMRAIPGSAHLAAQARLRNPFGRLTTPRDVADAIYLLATDEAHWINGALLRVDGGEHVSGAPA